MNRRHYAGVLLLLLYSVALGLFATHLNKLYYSNHGPFFDSVSYLEQLAWLIHAGRTLGVVDAVEMAASSSTVFLPFGAAAILSPLLPVSRAVGIWLQIPCVFLLLLSVWTYFRVRHGAGPIFAAFLALPSAATSGIFLHNGGISDFRMDLYLYLLVGSASMWLLIALHRGRRSDWLICGLCCVLASLSRGTAVAYLTVIFVPLLSAHFLLRPDRRRQVAGGVVVISLTWIALAAWFYVLNFDSLRYYYFVWNTDANAKLPLSSALNHFRLAFDFAGASLVIVCFLVGTGNWLLSRFVQGRRDNFSPGACTEIAWVAIAPAGMLALRGAGLNPFVSMPSAFGIVLFPLVLGGTWTGVSGVRATASSALLLGACLFTAKSGLDEHRSPVAYCYSNKPYKEILRILRENDRPTAVRVNMIGAANVVPRAFRSFLIYDAKFAIAPDEFLADPKGDLQVSVGNVRGTSTATSIEWAKMPGANDDEKALTLADQLVNRTEILLLPTAETAEYLSQNANYINRHVPRLRDALLKAGTWSTLAENLTFSDHEKYSLLLNLRPDKATAVQ
jgi:hypothetical protein